MMRKVRLAMRSIVAGAALFATTAARAQANLPAYTDHLVNGFDDWSWAGRDFSNTSPVHGGSDSIRVSAQQAWQALWLHHQDFNTSLYTSLSFWLHGGPNGGQVLQVRGVLNQSAQGTVNLSALPANTWKQFTIPLASLGIADQTNCNGFWLLVTDTGAITNTFYVDDVELVARPAPPLSHISLNATQTVRSVDARWFGLNTAIWDANLDTPQTISLLNEMGAMALRFPGGSLSDEYHWATGRSLSNTWNWASSFNNFVHVATNAGIGQRVFITVNYGTGTPAEAAAWVRSANVTNHLGFKYWEIGNENYGNWETDSNSPPHDAYTYALRVHNYLQAMKAADPTIKVGVVVAPGEASYSNSVAHPAYNPRTGQTNYGWTPIVMTTLKSLGATPDFAVHHRYPEYTDQESDPFLLQDSVGWANDATELRREIADYFGAGGENIELVCTENNSNSGAQGKQSVSIVNGLYYADSLGQLMKTEFNAFIWWDLRNGRDTSGSMDPVLYGWRMYGDLGMIDSLTNRYPPFYTAKLLQYFARPGDAVLNATSDNLLLSAYAARGSNGAVRLLVLNKDPVATFNAQINLAGFTPGSNAIVRSYGLPQDNAAQSGVGSPDLALTNFTGAGAMFNYNFPPYSATLLSLPPDAPKLAVQPAVPGTMVLQLQGQPSVRYILQSSPNLVNWTSLSTNLLSGATLNFTNAITPGTGAKFWRAVWGD